MILEAIPHSAPVSATGKVHLSLNEGGCSPDFALGAFSDEFLKTGAGIASAQAGPSLPAGTTRAGMPAADLTAVAGQSPETAGAPPATGKGMKMADVALLRPRPQDGNLQIAPNDKTTLGKTEHALFQEDQDGLPAIPASLEPVDAARAPRTHEAGQSFKSDSWGQPRPSAPMSVHVRQPVASNPTQTFEASCETSITPSLKHAPENAGSFGTGPAGTPASRQEPMGSHLTNSARPMPDSGFSAQEPGDRGQSDTSASGQPPLQPAATGWRSGTMLLQTVPAASFDGAEATFASEPTLTDHLGESAPDEVAAGDTRGSPVISSQRSGPVFAISPYPQGPNESMARAARILIAEGTTEISMNPKDLGRVNMVMSGPEHALSVVVTVERPETLELMRRHLEFLQKELENLGYADVTCTLTADRDPDRDAQGQGQSKDQAFGVRFSSDVDKAHSEAAQNVRRKITGIDIRL